jgi:hypothetical protein
MRGVVSGGAASPAQITPGSAQLPRKSHGSVAPAYVRVVRTVLGPVAPTGEKSGPGSARAAANAWKPDISGRKYLGAMLGEPSRVGRMAWLARWMRRVGKLYARREHLQVSAVRSVEREIGALAATLGEAARIERERRRLTLRQVTAAAGLGFSTVDGIESGRPASLETYVRLARALRLKPEFALVRSHHRSAGSHSAARPRPRRRPPAGATVLAGPSTGGR